MTGLAVVVVVVSSAVVVVVEVAGVTDETRPSGWKFTDKTPMPTPPKVRAVRNTARRRWPKAWLAIW